MANISMQLSPWDKCGTLFITMAITYHSIVHFGSLVCCHVAVLTRKLHKHRPIIHTTNWGKAVSTSDMLTSAGELVDFGIQQNQQIKVCQIYAVD